MKYSYLYGAYGTPTRYSLDAYKSKIRLIITALLIAVLVFGFTISQLINSNNSNTAEALQSTETSEQTNIEEIVKPENNSSEPAIIIDNNKDKKPIDMSGWLSSHKGSYGVMVYDQSGYPLVVNDSTKTFFMASIYKLYVAYIGYQNIESGLWKDDQNYWQDWSRTKCLDEMIRTSHSPCGETMMGEIGKTNIQEKLSVYGLENTSFDDFETSADDVATLLVRLDKNLDLTPDSKEKLLDSMKGQVYRDAMPSALNGWTVYDKVGFREQDEYHDVGIVVSPQGKTYVVAILTNGAGTRNIADLVQTIKQSL
ncbi:serine hydrolase [Candidatus Saccharibacteria bacterium]|nr:serine hydrolase [Candidatus Saccharibacteria bacterium]